MNPHKYAGLYNREASKLGKFCHVKLLFGSSNKISNLLTPYVQAQQKLASKRDDALQKFPIIFLSAHEERVIVAVFFNLLFTPIIFIIVPGKLKRVRINSPGSFSTTQRQIHAQSKRHTTSFLIKPAAAPPDQIRQSSGLIRIKSWYCLA